MFNLNVDARGLGVAWALDAQGFLLSQLRVSPEEFQARPDLVAVAPPEYIPGFLPQYYQGSWRQVALADLPPERVTRTVLKTWRDHWEQSPIGVLGQMFDADEAALTRMNLALQAFNGLAAGGTLTWTLHDNSRMELSQEQLQQVLTAVALRSAQLHVRYNQLKLLDPLPTLGEVKQLSFWIPAS